MILLALVFLPFFGGVFSYLLGKSSGKIARTFGILILALTTIVAIIAWPLSQANSEGGPWMSEFSYPWISSIGASFHFGLDGLSYVLVLLSLFLSFISVVNMSENPKKHEGLFIFLVLTTVCGVVGVLLAADLLLFFLFWEVMLVPLYFLILLFGEEHRQKAATRFLILTQASGLFLLLSIVFLYVLSEQSSFSFDVLAASKLSYGAQCWVAAGFLIAFLIKLPCVPFHFWMPSIFSSAPISALMAGLLVKTSAYGFIRFSKFSFPLFPSAFNEVSVYLVMLGIASMIYGALVAFSQNDMKKILAYSTISHVGVILAGLFSQNNVAYNGVVILLITQAMSTGGLLMISQHIQLATNSRELSKLSGLFKSMPNAGVMSLILVMASIGLPGLGNFVGEWLVLLGIFQFDPWLGSLACVGVVLSATYMLRFMHAIFFGPQREQMSYPDLGTKGVFLQTLIVLVLIVVGIYPSVVIDTVSPSIVEYTASIDTESDFVSPGLGDDS